MAQMLEQKIRVRRHRPLSMCYVCRKVGYEYVKVKNYKNASGINVNHKYLYTKHSNEPAIGFYSNGVPKYRECFGGVRVYDSLEEGLEAQEKKKKTKTKTPRRAKVVRPKPKPKRVSKVNCVKCHHRGRLGTYMDKGKTRQYVEHEAIEGTWGKARRPRHRRCYLRVIQ
jgi:hypothetical protein